MKRIARWIPLPVLLFSLQCAEPNAPATQQEIGQPLPGLVVSSPVAEDAAAPPSNKPSAYVSLTPGRLPLFSTVALRNETQKGPTIDISTADGGFDPIPIQANAGDRLGLIVYQSNGGPLTFTATVPSRRAPTIVRTNPARARPTSLLDIRPTVVFSEPINSATVHATSIGLYERGLPVAGTVALLAGNPWIAEFTPAQPLEAGTEYELQITRAIRDLDGDELETPTLVEFATGSLLIGATGRIAFATQTGPGGGYVYVANVDGTGLMQLPGGRAYYSRPHWSPDGRQIMVGRFHLDSLTSSVYVIDINAPARIRKLAGGGQPAWSPDGRKIAFVAPGGSLAPDHVGLFVMNADGTGARRITSPNDATQCTEGSSATDLKPNWSPDGSRIVFERDIHTDADGGFDCGLDGWGYVPRAHVVNADGTGLRRVMPVTSWGDGDPVWSPDGRSIALTSSCCGLAIIDAEGIGPARTVLQQFTFPGRFQLSPAWSPDGKYLLFVNVSQPYNQLFVVEVASGRARPIDIGVPGSIIDASWSPIR